MTDPLIAPAVGTAARTTPSAAPAPAMRRAPLRRVVGLLSSMRFAIALLTLIGIASVIGTVLRQGEPMGNYINQFGPFWASWLDLFGLYNVYSAVWFLLMLTFLVLSTALCIARNLPDIVRQWRTYQLTAREHSMKFLTHRGRYVVSEAPQAAQTRMAAQLQRLGWQVRTATQADGALHVLARKGLRRHKTGYLLTHAAIVLICLGGLIDGDMPVSVQAALHSKTPYSGGGAIAAVPKSHWLSLDTLSWRGTLLIPEKQFADVAVINRSDGLFLQPLPFSVELKKFIVEYYPTGMPKLFASEVVVQDPANGVTLPARIEVNHPLSYRGYTLYQSDFDDGGSSLQLQVQPLDAGRAFNLSGVVGGSAELKREGQKSYKLEYVGLRTINVENFSQEPESGAATARANEDTRSGSGARLAFSARSLLDQINKRLGAGNDKTGDRFLSNVGPSFSYRLRDSAGQAQEFNNYMLPVDMQDGGLPVFLLGVREQLSEPFRYVRLPADRQNKLDGFLRLRSALRDPDKRLAAAQAWVASVRQGRAANSNLDTVLRDTSLTLLELFAGNPAALARQDVASGKQEAAGRRRESRSRGGLPAIEVFIQQRVPAAEQEKAAETVIQILRESLAQLYRLEMSTVPAQPAALKGNTVAGTSAKTDATTPHEQRVWEQRFVSQAIFALSDMLHYPADIVLILKSFDHVQASVLQVSRAPGRYGVYLGSVLLMLGVFFLLYVRERRLWIWLRLAGAAADTAEAAASSASMAYSSRRKTLDAEHEYAALQQQLGMRAHGQR